MPLIAWYSMLILILVYAPKPISSGLYVRASCDYLDPPVASSWYRSVHDGTSSQAGMFEVLVFETLRLVFLMGQGCAATALQPWAPNPFLQAPKCR